jgi:hypothetical protein
MTPLAYGCVDAAVERLPHGRQFLGLGIALCWVGEGWSKSLRVLQRALMAVLAEHGSERRPFADGPAVRAIDLCRAFAGALEAVHIRA